MTAPIAITEPGEYAVTKAAYEMDPCQEPSLRASLAWILANKTPRHAWWECKRLNPDYVREEKRHFDIGTAAHTMMLGKGAKIELIDFDDYRTKEAREERDAAYSRGETPLLIKEHEEVTAMVAATRQQLQAMVDHGSLEAMPFQHNETERCIVWREDNGVWCRASLDGLSLDGEALSEFKSEGEDANPERWKWKARRLGYSFKLAFYCRGLSKLRICHSPTTRFFVSEKAAPYAMSCVRIDDELLAYEHARILQTIKTWGQCLSQDRWPGYSLDGYDLGLTEKERMAEQSMPNGGGHLSSDDIAATL